MKGYRNPLTSRYTDKRMQYIFSDDFKFRTWRTCWLALAESQFELGFEGITEEMLDEMRKACHEEIDYELAARKEEEFRHDVMAHIHEFSMHCPMSKGIIHLGATSMYVVDNTELIQIREALKIIRKQLLKCIGHLEGLALKHKEVVTLGYTHYQPAQPTTIGKRFTLYIQDLMMDLDELERIQSLIRARGAKGTVGTQASYLSLAGSYDKVKELDAMVSRKLGFNESFSVTAQTYPRKFDSLLSNALQGIGESAGKFSVDMRLASNLKIMEEPFSDNQTGSSAMPYKRNPMRSERMSALCRKLISLCCESPLTSSVQWFERTLDDSSIRRINIPEMFLAANAVLKLYANITKGLVVYEKRASRLLEEELPFMAIEEILMELCKKGQDRQDMHERIKKHSIEAGKRVKEDGMDNDLFARILDDKEIPLDKDFLDNLLQRPERFAGCAVKQTEDFLYKVRQRLEDYDMVYEEDDILV